MKPVTQAWLIKAAEDLDAIRSLRGNPHLTGVVAFHAQQCVEKCLKAVAEEQKGNVPRVHDLRRLWEVVADQFHEALDIDLLRELTDIYTDSRYPGDLGLTPTGKPTEKEAARFEQFADHVHATVLTMLS
ncbi:MAG: HEPN domain-containing protein [Phycisphaerae bacterium]|nr:HEPN domain-containing protein [Phycisphaerae bacterium]